MSDIVCHQYNDTGVYKVAQWGMSPYYQYEVKELYCDNCTRGKELEDLNKQMKSPDYVNPFSNLTDEQTIWMINRSSEFDTPNKLL